MVWEKNSVNEKFALHADICNQGSGFLATEGQNMRPNGLIYIEV